MHSVQNKLSRAEEKTYEKRKEFKIEKNISLMEFLLIIKTKNPIFKNLSENIVKGDIVGVYGPRSWKEYFARYNHRNERAELSGEHTL